MATGELPRALVCDNSALLAFSSNCSSESTRPSCDGDVGKIASMLTKKGVVKKSSIVTTTSEQCTKKGLQDAIGSQISMIPAAPDGDGLFIFVYCGGACSLKPLTDVKTPADEDEDAFVTVDFIPMSCKYSFLLTDFDSDKPETYVTGETIANAINSSPTSPSQLLIILDCPYAEEIGDDIKKHLNSCELSLIVSQGKGVASHYLSPLESSTFSYFFYRFLSEYSTIGVIKLRSLLPKVAACCDALSSLRMIRDGQWIRAGRAAPKGRFDQIIKSTDQEMKQIEEKPDDGSDDSDEQVDYEGPLSIGQFIRLYYKKYLINLWPAKLCDEAKDWVQAVIAGPLLVLNEHGQLADGKVLEAIAGSMMASIATIQVGFPQPTKSSNIFVQAYVYVTAAVDILDQNLKMFDVSLLKCAQEFYCGVLRANNIEDREVQELNWTKIEKCGTA